MLTASILQAHRDFQVIKLGAMVQYEGYFDEEKLGIKIRIVRNRTVKCFVIIEIKLFLKFDDQ